MEKVLRLYKIPDIDEIISVLSFVEDFDFPENAEEGDFVVNYDNVYRYRLFKYSNIYGELDWIDVAHDITKYYCAKNEETPLFFDSDIYGNLQPYDVSFPQNKRIAELTSFTYNATRMGNAPTISGTLMYRECLDELWTDRVCVFFNKTFHFIDKIPSSEYSNTDHRYKHSCEFVSERKLLENVYFTNVVDIDNYEGDITTLPMQWLEFTFFGGIDQFVSRLNLSLEYSNLDEHHVGFKVVKDTLPSVEEKLIQVSNTTLKAALDLIYETWQIPYWFDGYTIHIGYSNEQQMQQAGITMPTFQYGAVQSLLSLQKSQSNEIVNRIAGFGSSENIPVFYPNKNPNAIEIQYERNQTMMLNYARIANPYRVVGMKPSTGTIDYHPNGSYFKYMPITKTYTYDQLITINPHRVISVSEEEETPIFVSVGEANQNIKVKYDVLFSSDGQKVSIVKKMFVWLGSTVPESIVIKDHTGQFPLQHYCTNGEFVACPLHCTREEWEEIAAGNRGYSYGTPRINLTYTHSASSSFIDGEYVWTENYHWSDNTDTVGYDAKFPMTIDNFSYCEGFFVSHKITFPRTIWYGESNTPFEGIEAFWDVYLKDDTRTIITITKIDIENPDWSFNADGKVAHLWRYGIRLNAGVTPQLNDMIYFTRESDALPYFGQLLPYSFRDTKDIWLNAKNNYYSKEDEQNFYTFENLYKISCAKEHVENFDDIKPTIKGMMNNDTPSKRIDQILDVAFDQDDNNNLDESGEEYQHPYFFVKLAKTSVENGYGFNLFDCAIDGETMKFNMTDGNCGGCTFEVMVDYKNGMPVNPLGVFEQATTINGVTYAAGTPKRNLTTGRVLVNRNEEIQQDTSAEEVWIALKKDNETFGSYDNGEEVVFPDSNRGDNFIPKEGDGFTIMNICLPYAYIVEAEKRLYYALLDYMEKNNPRTWSFNIKFSSIYYKKHYEFMDKWLNESSLIHFVYNGITRKYYVQSYNYKASNNALPEVTIELVEEIRKTNILYPIPINNYPIQEIDYDNQQNKTKKILKKYINNILPKSRDVNNLHVIGDIIMPDGTSLNAQITALNSQIFRNEQINTPVNLWSKIKEFSEAENLFKDGLFSSEYNKFSVNDGVVEKLKEGLFGEDGLRITITSDDFFTTFSQKVFVEENSYYTVVFFAKSEDSVSVDVTLNFYDNKESLIKSSKHLKNQLSSDWNKFVILTDTPQDSYYMNIVLTKNK